MIGNLDHLGPWRPEEDSRYLGCPRHVRALDRLPFDRAWDRAKECPDCVAAVRGAA